MMLVRPRRCLGCRRCVIACKNLNHLEADDYRMTVQTFADEKGIDELLEERPILKMTWQPKFFDSCTFCAGSAEGQLPFCVAECPAKVFLFGDDAGAELAAAVDKKRLLSLPTSDRSRADVIYEIG